MCIRDRIKDDTKSKIKVARLGNSDELKVGQGVICLLYTSINFNEEEKKGGNEA